MVSLTNDTKINNVVNGEEGYPRLQNDIDQEEILKGI